METNLNWRQTRHECEGMISFITSRYYPKDVFLQVLKNAVWNLTDSHPWRDASREDEQKDMCVYGPNIVFEAKWGAFVIQFPLSIDSITPAQLYAFHGYVDSLGKALAELKIKGVQFVQGSLSFRLNGGVYNPQGFLHRRPEKHS